MFAFQFLQWFIMKFIVWYHYVFASIANWCWLQIVNDFAFVNAKTIKLCKYCNHVNAISLKRHFKIFTTQNCTCQCMNIKAKNKIIKKTTCVCVWIRRNNQTHILLDLKKNVILNVYTDMKHFKLFENKQNVGVH